MRTTSIRLFLATALVFSALSSSAAQSAPLPAPATASAPVTAAAQAVIGPVSPPSAAAQPAAAAPDPNSAAEHGRGSEPDVTALEGMRTGVQISLGLFLLLFLSTGGLLGVRVHRDHQLHQTVRLMVEKGAAIPEELLVPPRQGSDLRRGLVLVALGVGLSLFLAMLQDVPRSVWSVGLIPLLVGLAYLTVWKLEHGRTGHHPPIG